MSDFGDIKAGGYELANESRVVSGPDQVRSDRFTDLTILGNGKKDSISHLTKPANVPNARREFANTFHRIATKLPQRGDSHRRILKIGLL